MYRIRMRTDVNHHHVFIRQCLPSQHPSLRLLHPLYHPTIGAAMHLLPIMCVTLLITLVILLTTSKLHPRLFTTIKHIHYSETRILVPSVRSSLLPITKDLTLTPLILSLPLGSPVRRSRLFHRLLQRQLFSPVSSLLFPLTNLLISPQKRLQEHQSSV